MMALFTDFQQAYSVSAKAGWSFIDGSSWLPTRRWNRY